MFQNNILNDILTKYRENRLAHAYLIETNNFDMALKDLKKLIKTINCHQEYTEKCSACNLCNLITKDNLPSLKTIIPDGTSIKKSQIEELKTAFNTVPIYSKYNTYIIKNAEKLNTSSANSMLKFLEEPTPGIIGFFLTDNKDIIIDTIKSRCQTIILNYETKTLMETLNIDEETFSKYKTIIKTYLNDIDTTKNINNKKLTTQLERGEIETIMKIIFEIYYNTFLKHLGKEYQSYITDIYEIKDKLPKINQKLQIITKILTNMSYNVNTELILDKFVIEMRGTYE